MKNQAVRTVSRPEPQVLSTQSSVLSSRFVALARRARSALERALAYPLPIGSRLRISVAVWIVLSAAIAAHGLALSAQPLMLYPDSADFMGRAYGGLNGGKVWRGDFQFLPGYPYFLYALARWLPWPINTPLRLSQHACLIISHLCAFGIIRTLTGSRTFAVVVALSGLTNLGFLALGNQMISEPLYSAAVSVTALLLCKYALDPRPRLLIGAGLTIGLAALVRATGVYIACLPILLVGAMCWKEQRRFRALTGLAGCLSLIAACITPVLLFNHARMHYWGLTHYLGINLYARVIEYDKAYDPDAPAMRQILSLWNERQARLGENAGPAAWRSHWSCTHLVMEEGGLNQAQADDLLRRAALEGIRKYPFGYVKRTANNLVDALAADYRLQCYTHPDPPPADYPKDYFSAAHVADFAPYSFNKASIGSDRTARCFVAIDPYEPFGSPPVAAAWDEVLSASLDTYCGIRWEQRLHIWPWLAGGGALISLLMRPRPGWWVLFGLLGLHVVGAVAVEWPLPRYRLPFDMLLNVYPWLCVLAPLIILRRVVQRLTFGSTATAPPPSDSMPMAA
jgi:hypothetical protein